LVDTLGALLRRILSDRGEEMVQLAGDTIRNVSRGVVGIALLQSLFAGMGFLVVGIPAVGFLGFIALMLGIVQIGPAILLIPIFIWSWTALETTNALLFTAYMIPVGLLDNVLRPIVMARGLTTPMPVIFNGVVGGTIAYGISGLFLGPIVLSVAWVLIAAWVQQTTPLRTVPILSGGERCIGKCICTTARLYARAIVLVAAPCSTASRRRDRRVNFVNGSRTSTDRGRHPPI
jgi:predicted PurR-regulated permease PerM